MASFDQEFRATLNALKSRGCHVSQEWLNDCIHFFRSENNQYSLRDLETLVFEQWLLGDLRDTGSGGSLPPNLQNNFKIILEGKMACQVEYVTDIGHSSYTQMQRVRDEDVGNLQVNDSAHEFQQAWEPKSNRMLQLSLCDGAQTIKAIEYRPIPSLKTDLIPGSKILLKGPVLCRKGIVMLEEKHLSILGGEVDALVVVNAYENVLARKLNLPENPNPYKQVTADFPAAQPANPAPPQTNVQPPTRNLIQPQVNVVNPRGQQIQPTRASELPAKKVVQSTLSWAKQSLPANSVIAKTNHQPPPPPPPAEDFGLSDDDLLNMHVENAIMEAEMEYQRNVEDAGDAFTNFNGATLNSENASKTLKPHVGNKNDVSTAGFSSVMDIDMCSDDESLLLEASKIENVICEVKPTSPSCSSERNIEETSSSKRAASSALVGGCFKKPLFSKRRKETSSQEVSSTSDLDHLFDDEDFSELEDISLDASKPPTVAVPVILPHHPFVYLSSILSQKKESSKKYRVKAALITVTEKLSVSQGEWKLSALITDGSAKVNVRFSGKVLEKLIGMRASTMVEMKRKIEEQPSNKEIIKKTLEEAQKRFIHLNCLMDIKMDLDQDLPTVVSFEEVSSQTVSALRMRQNSL